MDGNSTHPGCRHGLSNYLMVYMGTLDQCFARNAAVVQAVTAESLVLFDEQGFRPELSGTGRDGFSSSDGFIPQARVKSRNGRMPRRCILQTDFWSQERRLPSVDY